MCVPEQCSFSSPEGLPNVSGHINASHNNFSKTTPVFSLGRKRLSDEEIEQLKEESYDQLSEGMIQSLRTKTRKMIKSCEYFFRIHLVLRTKFTSRIKLKTCFSSQYRNKKSYQIKAVISLCTSFWIQKLFIYVAIFSWCFVIIFLLDSVICADVYDRDSCQSVKSRGYCQKFPNSMRTTCGITCNLCGKGFMI